MKTITLTDTHQYAISEDKLRTALEEKFKEDIEYIRNTPIEDLLEQFDCWTIITNQCKEYSHTEWEVEDGRCRITGAVI